MAMATLMLAQAAPAAAPDPAAMMAERLHSIEASVGQDHAGVWQCSLSASSGSARLDELLCQAATTCARDHGNDREQLGWCMDRARSAVLADVRRTGRRSRR